MPPLIRRAGPEDAEALARLCADHARYERAAYDPSGHAARLAAALSGPEPRAMAWLALAKGAAVGFASGAVEFSTWTARPFLHLDCLYLDEARRGQGLGAQLLEVIRTEARARRLATVQWWTPAWNIGAIGFHARHGAQAVERLRFELDA